MQHGEIANPTLGLHSTRDHEIDVEQFSTRSMRARPLLVFAWVIALFAGLLGGPRLGDHEVIVAQTARQMLADGDWIVPHYLDTAFLVKPPLPYWCTAVLSKFMPFDAVTGLPVSHVSARLTSVLATLATVWLVWRLGRDLFGPAVGRVSTIAYATSIGTLLFALNATAEALLTACSTWTIAEYWWATHAQSNGRRVLHLIRFYTALALAMLAKGPMPLIVVVAPLAAWIILESPIRSLATRRASTIHAALRMVPRKGWQTLGRLQLWWGLPLLFVLLAPWVAAVAQREPFVFRLWNYEYLDRLRGQYPGVDRAGPAYYLPILLGLIAPWTLSLPQALASPFRACHRHQRRSLAFVWCWVVVGLVLCSMMDFKKPYYIVPFMPGWALLLGPTLARFFQTYPAPRPEIVRRLQWLLPGLAVAGLVIAWVILHARGRTDGIADLGKAPLILTCAALTGIFVAFLLFARNRRWSSFMGLAATSIVVFIASWLTVGPQVDNADHAIELAAALKRIGVTGEDVVVWCDGRPDGRVTFYGNRAVRQVVDPYRTIVAGRSGSAPPDYRWIIADRICDQLESASDAYFVFERGDLKQLAATFRPPYREAAVVRRERDVDSNSDWVVVTNRRATDDAP